MPFNRIASGVAAVVITTLLLDKFMKNILLFPKFNFRETDNLACYMLSVLSMMGGDSS